MKSSRRSFLKFAGVGIGGLMMGAPFAGLRKAKRPNFLFIITDDMFMREWNIRPEGRSADGRVRNYTPNIDRLINEGMYFNRMYANSSVCTPSRYSCITGRFPSRCPQAQERSVKNSGQVRISFNTHILSEESTGAKLLRQAGYFTGFVGKNHALNFKRPNIPPDLEKKDPFSPEVSAWAKGRQADIVKALKEQQGFEFAENVYWGGAGVGMGDAFRHHNIDWTVEGGLHFLDEASKRDNPWYLYFSTTLLHGPTDKDENGWPGRYKADERVSGEGMLKSRPDVEPYMPPRNTIPGRIKKAGANPSTGDVTWLDDGIGALLKKLEELKMLDNTLIIMFNDNGMDNGGKNTGYNEGYNVSSFAWGGMVSHGVTESLAGGVDFVPTFLDMAGVRKEKWAYQVDGKSLAPIFKNPQAKAHKSMYCEIGHSKTVFTDDGWMFLAVRHPEEIKSDRVRQERFNNAWGKHAAPDGSSPDSPYDHHGMCPAGPTPDTMGYRRAKVAPSYYDSDQLYNLKEDPSQQVNLAENPKYRQKTKEMRQLLKSYLNTIPGKFGELKTEYKALAPIDSAK